jgi:hypothetical protein
MSSASDVPCYALWGLVGVLFWAATLTVVLVLLWRLPVVAHDVLARLLPAADLADPPNTEEPERTTL